jgi:hypothetical protein
MDIYQTPFTIECRLEESAVTSVSFLARNKHLIVSEQDIQRMLSVRNYSETAMRKAAEGIINAGKIKHFCFISTHREADVPETLSTPYLLIDTMQSAKVSDMCSHIPELRNKIIINVTPFTKIVDGSVVLKDVVAFHAALVRAHTILQDYDSGLPESLNNFIVRSYTIVAASLISRKQSLDLNDIEKLRACIALYYSQRVSDSPESIPSIFDSQKWLGNTMMLKDMLINTELVKPRMDLENLGELISSLIVKCRHFDDQVYVRTVSNITTDPITSNICHDYPPFWIYQILLSISNYSTSLTYHFKNDNLYADALKFGEAYVNTCVPRSIDR